MNFKAKVKIDEIIEHKGIEESLGVVMSPITSQDTPENKTFSKYTPSGQIRLLITNPSLVEALKTCKPGKVYFVEFTEELEV